MGLGLLGVVWFLTTTLLGASEGVDAWIRVVGFILLLIVFTHMVFFLRVDLRLPKDRPVRFNRSQGKVYANEYQWSYNPFGRWHGTARVLDWSTLQAEITKQFGASGEVVTQRYSVDLVVCKSGEAAGSFEEVDRFRLQQGAQTTVQYAEQWELIRRYMAEGLAGVPAQSVRERHPGFLDCLLFAMPWFAPTPTGRQARLRMRGFWGTLMATLLSLLFPLWLVFGLATSWSCAWRRRRRGRRAWTKRRVPESAAPGPWHGPILEAIVSRRRLALRYNGKPRRVEPQCYGIGRKGTSLLRVHQLEGGSEREPLFDVGKIEELALLDETFTTPGPNYSRDDSAMIVIYAQL